MTIERAKEVGRAVGAAIADLVLSQSEGDRRWTGLDTSDKAKFTAAGLDIDFYQEWTAAEGAAREEYLRRVYPD